MPRSLPLRIAAGGAWLVCLTLLSGAGATARAADVALGTMVDEAGHPLRRSPVHVYDRDYALVAVGWTGDNGAYCIGDEAIGEGRDLWVCATASAGPSPCADGDPHTVAGGMLGAQGKPLRHADVFVRVLERGMVVAVGRTDRDGFYCVRDPDISPGTLYEVCARPASIGAVPGGVNGAAFGAESVPLRQAAIRVYDREGRLVATGRTGFDGTYCVTSEAIRPGVAHRLCFEGVAGAARCSGGRANAISGALTEPDGRPVTGPLEVLDSAGDTVASGATNQNGSYCIVDSDLRPGEVYEVCLERVPHCACCCNCCCGGLVLSPSPLGYALIGAAAVGGGTAIGISLTGGEGEVSPAQ